jgi:hypothetical protein
LPKFSVKIEDWQDLVKPEFHGKVEDITKGARVVQCNPPTRIEVIVAFRIEIVKGHRIGVLQTREYLFEEVLEAIFVMERQGRLDEGDGEKVGRANFAGHNSR